MHDSKKGSLPMSPGTILSKIQCPSTAVEQKRMSEISYASAIGSIMYAMICPRLDVSFALNVTSRYQSCPDKDDSRSQAGFVFRLNGGAVSWKSTKQDTVADSATEAEYIAASEAAKESVWIRKFVSELGVVPSASCPLDLYSDNIGAIAQAKEP
ncbi:hypothetical protein U9M48_018916, partial [Paspalum notatum var. saurae]